MSTSPSISFGIDQILKDPPVDLKSARIGLVTNNVANTTTGQSSRVALKNAGINLQRLFGPEHGISASAPDGDHVTDSTDPCTGLPVTSLYGSTQKPRAESLANIDVLMFDIPDVGSRFYTYSWTLSYILEAAAEHGKPLYILDRPNPISGDLSFAEGPMLDESFVSTFVGRWAMPIRHCLTLGELAQFWNAQKKLNAELHVIPCAGWNRSMHWPDTALPFVAPSPNMPSYESALLYPGTCLIEGTNLSEGRGTPTPFQTIGAPFVEGETVAQMLNDCRYPGIHADPISFTPTSRKFEGKKCSGVQLRISDPRALHPVAVGLALVGICARLYPDDMQWFPLLLQLNPKQAAISIGSLAKREFWNRSIRAPLISASRAARWTRADGWRESVTPHLLYS